MSQVIAAATLYISANKQITGVFSDSFLDFGRRDVFGIPIVVYYLVAIALVLWYVLEMTPLGRHLFATGANPESARLSGVRTDQLVWGSLVASAVVAGIAGIIYGAKIGSFSNSFGPPLLFPAFAAVFFGSTQFRNRGPTCGGRSSPSTPWPSASRACSWRSRTGCTGSRRCSTAWRSSSPSPWPAGRWPPTGAAARSRPPLPPASPTRPHPARCSPGRAPPATTAS